MWTADSEMCFAFLQPSTLRRTVLKTLLRWNSAAADRQISLKIWLTTYVCIFRFAEFMNSGRWKLVLLFWAEAPIIHYSVRDKRTSRFRRVRHSHQYHGWAKRACCSLQANFTLLCSLTALAGGLLITLGLVSSSCFFFTKTSFNVIRNHHVLLFRVLFQVACTLNLLKLR